MKPGLWRRLSRLDGVWLMWPSGVAIFQYLKSFNINSELREVSSEDTTVGIVITQEAVYIMSQ